jgi:hypothetical protein
MNIYNKIQDEMNRTLSTAATAGLAILLLVGCSSAPATPAAKLPVALTTTEAPTPAPTATSSDAAYLSTMNAIDPAKGDALLVAMAHTRCGDLDLGTTVDELEAKEAAMSWDVVTSKIGIMAAIVNYCPQHADQLQNVQ